MSEPPRPLASTRTANPKRPTMVAGKSVIPGASAILGMEDVEEILDEILADAAWLKSRKDTVLPQLLAGKAILMIYEKNSTRTRVSFEVGVQRLGGIAVNIDSQTSQMGRGESI